MRISQSRIRLSRGFTLIEVIIAIAIIAIALISLIEATSIYVRNTTILYDKVVSHWVASNILNELLLKNSFPNKIEKQGEEIMVGQKWPWKVKVKDTLDKKFRSIEVKVFKNEAKNSLSTLVSYVTNAVVACEKINDQQIACQPWDRQ